MNPQWTNSPNDTGSVTAQGGGILSLTPGVDTARGSFVGYQAAHAYDLRWDSISVHVLAVTGATGESSTTLGARYDGNNFVEFQVFGDRLKCRLMFAGTETNQPDSVAYDANAHAWWRISEAGGVTSWEVSPTGEVWTTLWTAATPEFARSVRPRVVAGVAANPDGNAPGTARFADFNTRNPLPDSPLCDIHSRRDTFGAAALDLEWTPSTTDGCQVDHASGSVTFRMTGAGDCFLLSRNAYRFTGSTLDLRVGPGLPTEAGTLFMLIARPLSGSGGPVVGVEHAGAFAWGPSAFLGRGNVATGANFWRLKPLNNSTNSTNVEFALSPDGAVWTPLMFTGQGTFQFDETLIGFGIRVMGNNPPSQEQVFTVRGLNGGN